MRGCKIITRILLILPIINFTFALPATVQGTRKVNNGVISDSAMTMSAKRGNEKVVWEAGVLSAAHRPSDLARSETNDESVDPPQFRVSSPSPDHDESRNPPHLQAGTSEIQPVELSPPESVGDNLDPSFASVGKGVSGSSSTDVTVDSADSESVGSAWSTSNSALVHPQAKPKLKLKSFLSKWLSKLKIWRRISDPVSVKDAVNPTQRDLQGLVDSGAPWVPATGGVRRPAARKPS